MKKVRTGESLLPALTAEWYNSTLDSAKGDGGPPAALDGEWSDPYGVRVKVQNDTGGNLDRFAVVGLGAPIFSAASSSGSSLQYFKNKPLFSGATPVVNTHWNKPAILLQSIASGKIGDALISGFVPVQIDIQHAAHTWADVMAGTASLSSYATGSCKILSTISQTGVQWCMVQMGLKFLGPLKGLTDAAIIKGASGAVSIYTFALADTGYNVTATNPFANVAITRKVHVVEIETSITHPAYDLSAAEC